MKNNLSRGIRKASDFLMALQLTGAYKHTSSIANLQVQLPAIVIGGGLTAIDTATELLAYYLVQIEKDARALRASRSGAATPRAIRAMFDDEEWEALERQLGHAPRAPRGEARAPRREGREPDVQPLLDRWGGVTLVYRKRSARLARVSPEPRRGGRRASRRACATSRTCRRSRRCSTSAGT